MKINYRYSFLTLPLLFTYCNYTVSQESKDKKVGGPCDNCDLMFEGIPAIQNILSETMIAPTSETGERMEISGKVYKMDGKTAASDIIVYIYHTNAAGLYSPTSNQKYGRLHGHLRSWVKTNGNGEFKFTSIRPASYPHSSIPSHIHILIKEPGKSVYYIDELWFDDDPFITEKLRKAAEKRGGDLVIHLNKNQSGVWKGHIKITLGLHIPDYN